MGAVSLNPAGGSLSNLLSVQVVNNATDPKALPTVNLVEQNSYYVAPNAPAYASAPDFQSLSTLQDQINKLNELAGVGNGLQGQLQGVQQQIEELWVQIKKVQGEIHQIETERHDKFAGMALKNKQKELDKLMAQLEPLRAQQNNLLTQMSVNLLAADSLLSSINPDDLDEPQWAAINAVVPQFQVQAVTVYNGLLSAMEHLSTQIGYLNQEISEAESHLKYKNDGTTDQFLFKDSNQQIRERVADLQAQISVFEDQYNTLGYLFNQLFGWH